MAERTTRLGRAAAASSAVERESALVAAAEGLDGDGLERGLGRGGVGGAESADEVMKRAVQAAMIHCAVADMGGDYTNPGGKESE